MIMRAIGVAVVSMLGVMCRSNIVLCPSLLEDVKARGRRIKRTEKEVEWYKLDLLFINFWKKLILGQLSDN